MTLNKLSNLQQRLAISGLCIGMLVFAITVSFYPYYRLFFSLIGAGVFCAAVWELYSIGKAKGFQPLDSLGVIGTASYTLAVFLSTQTAHAKYLPDIIMGLIVCIAFLYYFVKGNEPFINLAITLFAFIYLTIPLNALITINYFFPRLFP